MIQRSSPVPMALLLLSLATGCVEPGVAPERVRALETGMLGFLRVGVTSREEVLLRLGTPVARFEGDRILTFDFVLAGKEWQRVGVTVVSDWRLQVPTGTCSLVLVFDPRGVLVRMNLVRQERRPPLPAEETGPNGGPASGA